MHDPGLLSEPICRLRKATGTGLASGGRDGSRRAPKPVVNGASAPQLATLPL